MTWIRSFWSSTIGKKIVMAVTGVIGIGFVIGHMLGNLQAFEGAEKINAYGRFLHHTIGLELWIIRIVLLAAVILHVVAAVQLTRISQSARPVGYSRKKSQAATLASRAMRYGGLLLLIFIIVHIMQFTTRSFPGYDAMDPAGGVDVYANLLTAFQNPWWVLFYAVAMLALALHLYHGAWSSVRTIGASKPSANPLKHGISLLIAAVVAGGFVLIPFAVFFGVLR